MHFKRIFRWLKVIILIYCSIGILLYVLQEKFLFHPEKLKPGYRFTFNSRFEEVNIPMNETDTVNLVKFFPEDSMSRGVVVYFHGNRQHIERYARFAANFTKQGYEVWMQDYPGYGKSTGKLTEKKLYAQALQVQKMAASTFGKDSIIIYGKSLGTGIAAYVASATNNKRLILETPYYSIPTLFSCYAPIYPANRMSTFKIPVHEFLSDVDYPVSIFHGTRDGVIPYRNAVRLKGVLKANDEFITIERGTHQNLNDFPLFRHKLDSLLDLR